MNKKIRYTNIFTLMVDDFEKAGNPIFPIAINPMLNFLHDRFNSKIPELHLGSDSELYLYQICMGTLMDKGIIYLGDTVEDEPYCDLLRNPKISPHIFNKMQSTYGHFHNAILQCIQECDDIDPHYAAIIHSVAVICKNTACKRLTKELSMFRVMDVLKLTYPELDEVAGYEFCLEMLRRNLLDLKV